MEPHSEKRGNLGDKFEGFAHTPSDQVWERIAATPTDRPLGAKFVAFLWKPNPRVWRRISAQLQPAWRRTAIVWWSAAAGIALLIGIGLLLPNASEPARAFNAATWPHRWGTGHDFAQDHLSIAARQASQPTVPADAATNHEPRDPSEGNLDSGFRFQAKSTQPPIPNRPLRIRPDSKSAFAAASGDQDHVIGREHETQLLTIQRMESRPVRSGITPDPAEVDPRVTFWQMLAQEAEMEAIRAMDLNVSQQRGREDHEQPDGQWFASAGSNLSAGGNAPTRKDLAATLEDYYGGNTPNTSSDFNAAAAPKENYSTPLVLGAYVDRPITHRIGVAAGLVFTQMHSYVESESGNLHQRMDAKRQYLGIATSATYSLPLTKGISAFGSGGIQFDFGLGRQSILKTYSGPTLIDRQEVKDGSGQQANVNLGLGLRFAVLPKLGLFAQCNAAHYFFQTQPNLYSTKPIWPMLQAGLRVTL